jgi:hypothetical protein
MYEQYIVEMCFAWENLQDEVWDIFERYLNFQAVSEARLSTPDMFAIATSSWNLEDSDADAEQLMDSDSDSDSEVDQVLGADTSLVDYSEESDSEMHTSLNDSLSNHSLVIDDESDNEDFRSV